jgi:chromosome segregation ATPase
MPPSHQYDPNTLIEIKTLLATNEQLVRGIVDELRQITSDLRSAQHAIHDLKSEHMVSHTRLDRFDRDNEDTKKERKAMAMMILTSLVTAILAVIIPLVIRPSAVNPPSISTPAK